MVTAACVAWIIAAIKSFRSGKGKAAKITAIVLAGIFQLFAAAFLVMSIMREYPDGSTIVNDDFVVVSGDYKYTVPFLSGAFAAISKYVFFAAIGVIAEAGALAGLILQIVLFVKSGSQKKKASAEKIQAEQQKAAAEKTLKEQNEKKFSGEKVCVLGNKRIIKSNAAAVYREYLENKKAADKAE